MLLFVEIVIVVAGVEVVIGGEGRRLEGGAEGGAGKLRRKEAVVGSVAGGCQCVWWMRVGTGYQGY